jgi:hypothetical protein
MEAVESGEEDRTEQSGPLVSIRQRMIAGHGLQQDGCLRSEVGVLLEIPKPRPRSRQRGSGKCLVREGTDGCEIEAERFCSSSMEVVDGRVDDFPAVGSRHQRALLRQAVERSAILLPGKPQERVDIFRRIAPLSPIKSDARDKDVFRFVPTAGTHVLLC